MSLDDFRARKLLPNEVLHVFLHELRQLLKLVMPEASDDTRKQLLLHQFVSGLPVSISKQLRATGEVNDLDVVMERAKLLMIIEEPQKVAAIQTTEIQDLKEQISLLTEQVAALSVKPLRQSSTVVYYKCQQPGHVQRNCPSIKEMLSVWTSWSCCETMSIGKWPRGVSEGAEIPQEQLEPHNVISVVVAAVRPNAAIVK